VTGLAGNFRTVITGPTSDNSLRELSGAIAMNMLLDRSGERINWLEFDRVLQVFGIFVVGGFFRGF
jgi:hypothetical protein